MGPEFYTDVISGLIFNLRKPMPKQTSADLESEIEGLLTQLYNSGTRRMVATEYVRLKQDNSLLVEAAARLADVLKEELAYTRYLENRLWNSKVSKLISSLKGTGRNFRRTMSKTFPTLTKFLRG